MRTSYQKDWTRQEFYTRFLPGFLRYVKRHPSEWSHLLPLPDEEELFAIVAASHAPSYELAGEELHRHFEPSSWVQTADGSYVPAPSEVEVMTAPAIAPVALAKPSTAVSDDRLARIERLLERLIELQTPKAA